MNAINTSDSKTEKKETVMNKILGAISGSFAPILGVLAGSGLISALISILTTLGWLSPKSGTYAILGAAGHAIFYFFPVFLGITLALKLGANGYVGGAIGAALLEPHFTDLVASHAQNVNFLGIPVILASYSSTVFPILIAVSIYSVLDKFLKKVIYKDLQMFVNPLISLLVIVPLTVLIFGPFGTYVGGALAVVIKLLSSTSGMLTGAVMGAAWSFLTILGLHWAVIPIFIANLAAGGDPLSPMIAAAPFAQIGLGLGVFFKTKDKDLKTLAASGLVPGALAGTTEIITYGILVRYKRTMLIVAIAGAIGGAINGMFGVKGTAFALPSFLSVPVFTPIGLYLIGTLTALVIAMVLTLILGYEGKSDVEPVKTVKDVNRETILSPLSGEIVPLSKISDPLFSTETVGKGIAIDPTKGEVVSPVDGVVTTLFPTEHAIGITSEDGAEILIIVGVNTIKLKGQFFTSHVKQWDTVKKGDLLIEFDIENIKAAGYDVKTPVVITNTNQYIDVVPTSDGNVQVKDELIRLVV
ncbi:PTS beta-glucoside transporter subunit EIIBCA [Bacillus sp. AFS076308]|uniref:glucose PTS transporter subunit IIA n=1 Tax=unclassified Bacillus (in: firmicutes) TaxID=185979 RepID=UPI000BF87926|nr:MULTISPECIES: glucose PTS transporter subunit IIA [unclassified Bacillus (in: firmicutes)]PFO08364.1 PTS beta-glucoside transporter subunit EIIBCA [Bacillus sp. AFS076308]PGV50627.1 PTS beta-glucoside transporter subunit EIIBCA [Bacillus sp. AFS037270]